MKLFYTLFFLCLLKISAIAQSYEYGLVYDGNNRFSVVATSNFTSSSDISDVGFTLTLPTGNFDIINLSQFNGRSWTTTKITAQQLTDLYGQGDGTKDYFVFTMPPEQTIVSHTSSSLFTLVSFDVTNTPTVGEIAFLTNDNPVAVGLNTALNSFFNSNIDNTTTKDYFGGLIPERESIAFGTLGIEPNTINKNNINLYPNPSSNFISIKTPLIVEQVLFYDMSGKFIFSSTETSNIPISHLKDGMYLVKILINNNSFERKLIKH